MIEDAAIVAFVLRELRLRASTDHAGAAKLVTDGANGDGLTVPLLSSIEDHRDVAFLRAVREGEPAEDGELAITAALATYGASVGPARHYRARLAVNSPQRPLYFRLAVTESGINESGRPAQPRPSGTLPSSSAGGTVELLWIGEPRDSRAGLMVLVGHPEEGAFATQRQTSDWPLPFSASLGVRIYAGHAA